MLSFERSWEYTPEITQKLWRLVLSSRSFQARLDQERHYALDKSLFQVGRLAGLICNEGLDTNGDLLADGMITLRFGEHFFHQNKWKTN